MATPPVSLSLATATHCSGLFAGCMVRHMMFVRFFFLRGKSNSTSARFVRMGSYSKNTHTIIAGYYSIQILKYV